MRQHAQQAADLPPTQMQLKVNTLQAAGESQPQSTWERLAEWHSSSVGR